ncbi:MAG: exosome complex protein Rrp42 [Candidatus Woesearchaeota archaeon]|mgnify:FL=1|jgi:exosome complex component RRP42|nr:exosome complex protein Rrp42 [Candidatus Woesearchaeota archaeon]MDP7199039.1 exosome complex protein Rrp42 [Candidatus Woesearchaeota archaeon]MDP7467707.1 exosome complex protein Rrp42 [Candidatus Woesearchaeota archaeon]MDP7646791.1 exosome complex protein Rrp42 [Candidatus Woesearchaeota archaeon]
MNREHLLKALAKGVRYDGRKLDEYRPVKVEKDVSHSAEGSAKVTIGATEVIVGVKMGCEKPYSDTPEEGNLMVNVELLPLSADRHEPGPPTQEGIELSRVTDRGIRESKALDVKKLCVTKGELVWNIMVDACTLNDDGGMFDAIGLGAMAALQNAKYPELEDGVVNYDKKSDVGVPLDRDPLPVTVYKAGPHLFVDPTIQEQLFADSRLTISVTRENTIVALQKGGPGTLTVADIDTMVGIALKKAPELRKAL